MRRRIKKAHEWIRTTGPLFTKELLYQLSHVGVTEDNVNIEVIFAQGIRFAGKDTLSSRSATITCLTAKRRENAAGKPKSLK